MGIFGTLLGLTGNCVKKGDNDIFVKVEKGYVVVFNKNGNRITSFRHSSGDALFADYSPDNDRILVTTSKGNVVVCERMGGYRYNFSTTMKIVLARWSGDDVFVQLEDGSCQLHSQSGSFKKRL